MRTTCSQLTFEHLFGADWSVREQLTRVVPRTCANSRRSRLLRSAHSNASRHMGYQRLKFRERQRLQRFTRRCLTAVTATLLCFGSAFDSRKPIGLRESNDWDALHHMMVFMGARQQALTKLKKPAHTMFDPRPPPTMWDWDEVSFERTFRFKREDFKRLMQDLQLPASVRTKKNGWVNGELALLLFLYR